MTEVILTVLGFLIGLIGSVAGVGGGFFVMPYLIIVCSFSPVTAVATSLSVIFLGSLSATVTNFLNKSVDVKTGILLLVFSMLFVIVGTYLLQITPDKIYYVIFSGVLFILALALFIVPRVETEKKIFQSKLFIPILGIVTGLISSLFGLGGGIIIVPCLMLLLSFETKRATATSQFILVFTTLTGLLILNRFINLNMTLFMGGGAVVGAQIGIILARQIERKFVQRMVAVLISIVAIQILIRVIF